MSNRAPSTKSTSLRVPSFESLFLLTGVVASLVIADIVFWWVGRESWRNPLGWNLAMIAALVGGARFIFHSVSDLMEWKFGADLALALALVAALLLNETWVASEVVLIALIGESLEAFTFRRSQRELRQLLSLQPATVRVRYENEIRDMPLAAVEAGFTAVIRPGERIPVDGVVVTGRSAVDESSLTGESLPAEKEPGNEVFAGTLNQLGALDVRVTHVGEQSVLGQMLHIVSNARRNKAHVERLVDRFAAIFLPAVLLIAALTFVVTNFDLMRSTLAAASNSSGRWQWMPTLAVLVVACPCALVLATPAAMMASLAWLARRGIIIKGGASLERLARTSHFAFDKTGTLTQGQARLVECLPLPGHASDEVIAIAAAAEQQSEHIIARAILHAARERNLVISEAINFTALLGAGVQAQIAPGAGFGNVSEVVVGSPRVARERNFHVPPAAQELLTRLDRQGLSALFVCRDEQVIGVLGIGDTVRPEAAAVLSELRAAGVDDFAIVSGDRASPVRAVARTLGIERFAAELSPTEKANWIADWSRPNRLIAMVGDGINDAPALATADVGIALRAVGSEIAAEAADVILLGEPLRPLPDLVRIARQTVRVIYENMIVFAFAANLLGIVLTAWILPAWSDAWESRAPIAAAIFHQAGSVLVLLNSMRLLWSGRCERSWFGRCESWLCGRCEQLWQRTSGWRARAGWVWSYRQPLIRVFGSLLLLAYLSQIVIFVQPDEVAIVQRFGGYLTVLPPGAHLRLPPPFDRITREQPNRIRTLEIGPRRDSNGAVIEWSSAHPTGETGSANDESMLMTGDQSLIEVGATIQYRIRDVRQFRFSVQEPSRILRVVAESALREHVASRPLLADSATGNVELELLTRGRTELESQIAAQMQQHADRLQLGIEILPGGVCLQDVHPPLAVVGAFRDVSSAYKEMERMRNEADTYRRDKLIQTAGEAVWHELSADCDKFDDELWTRLRPKFAGEVATELNAAQAFAADQEQSASGEAAAFVSRQAAHATAPRLVEWRLFMDTWGESLAGKRKLVLDKAVAGRRQLLLGFPREPTVPLLPPAEPQRPPDDE